MLTAFLIKWYKSSGRPGAKPFAFKILKILLPVTKRTWATPCESLRITPLNIQILKIYKHAININKVDLPIWDGVKPFLANLKICSLTFSDVNFCH